MEIRQAVQKRLALLTKLRQDLHKIPEPSGREYQTQRYICAFLAERGIPFIKIETGVVADFKGGDTTRKIAFRADMDALPIAEKTPVPYAAQNGCMHACGHDGHTAMLLTLCDILAQTPPPCNVRAIFQFGEEGAGGADIMERGGALEGVGEIYALHVDPTLPTGRFASRVGAMMAGAVEFTVRFTGMSAHCAEPQKGRDALKSAAELIARLQDISCGHTLLHIGKLTGGAARNVVAANAECEGTLRYFDEEARASVMGALGRFLEETDKQFGTAHTVITEAVYPPLVNTAAAFRRVNRVIEVLDEVAPRYTAEDFAFFTRKIEGCLIWLGVQSEEFSAPLHADTFGFLEDALTSGVELYLRILESFCEE